MAVKYDYTKDPVNLDDLTDEINDSSIASAVLTHINWNAGTDGLKIWFDVSLSGADKTTLDGLVSSHAGNAYQSLAGDTEIRTVDPTVNEDVSTGYYVGCVWVNASASPVKTFICEDETDGAAVWSRIDQEINDGGTSSDETWSASKIDSELSGKASSSHTHALADATGTDTLANINGKISDATLIDTSDSRLSDERTANAIATTGADVNVDAAAPPTTGQVLKATSATTATWQAEAGGSAITVEDEGTPLTTAVTKFNFAGAGVTVTEPVTDEMLVTIPGGGVTSINFMINHLQDTGATWTSTGSPFIFPGTTAMGTPTAIKIISGHNSTDADIRVYDVTNSLVIGTKIGVATAMTINDIGTLSNLPSGQAMWEVQFQENGSGKVDIHSISIDF